jgi:hypothetical protein
MTEEEWLTANNPRPMLESIRGKASDRRLRLFAVACCRRIWHLFTDPSCRSAVETAEQFADADVKESEMDLARTALVEFQPVAQPSRAVRRVALKAAFRFSDDPVFLTRPVDEADIADEVATVAAYATGVKNTASQWKVVQGTEKARQAKILRDIFGNPFRPVIIDQSWLTSTVADLARLIYDERAFDRLPILADALMDAGCDNDDVLNHCRSAVPHVRGCWVVDLLTGRK